MSRPQARQGLLGKLCLLPLNDGAGLAEELIQYLQVLKTGLS
jgi:hypothetical protein